ncbi:hypothetical protein B9Z55_007497 [Caenorhabditis nigoni]|uniref:Zinc finger PHD-type domain-containing protein n=1 Tax=Caenorhabditis nigoni TaxID=1611254 RepID=A0A2G5V9W8_9PELO|nr:hypothetical protein B9Z55_007497 [Caenorhabditis nigoni]
MRRETPDGYGPPYRPGSEAERQTAAKAALAQQADNHASQMQIGARTFTLTASVQCVNCGKWWHNFCLYLNRETYDEDFLCCGDAMSKEVPEAKSGQTKHKWEQMHKDAQKK